MTYMSLIAKNRSYAFVILLYHHNLFSHEIFIIRMLVCVWARRCVSFIHWIERICRFFFFFVAQLFLKFIRWKVEQIITFKRWNHPFFKETEIKENCETEKMNDIFQLSVSCKFVAKLKQMKKGSHVNTYYEFIALTTKEKEKRKLKKKKLLKLQFIIVFAEKRKIKWKTSRDNLFEFFAILDEKLFMWNILNHVCVAYFIHILFYFCLYMAVDIHKMIISSSRESWKHFTIHGAENQ